MYELRIVNEGGDYLRFPLSDKAVSLGADVQCDVCLPGGTLSAFHALVHKSNSGWRVIYLNIAQAGTAVLENAGCAGLSKEYDCGAWVQLGKSYLTVCASNPHRNRLAPAILGKKTILVLSRAKEYLLRSFASPGRFSRSGWPHLSLLFCCIAGMTAACAYSLNNFQPAKIKAAEQVISEPVLLSTKDSAAPTLAPEKLATVLASRLKEAGLLKRFTLQLQGQDWKMQATLDDEECQQFERLFVLFMREFKISFPVSARISGIDTLLPFKIRKVVSGENASLLTQDGVQLGVGDEYLGVQVIAIRSDKLVFSGKRRFVVRL